MTSVASGRSFVHENISVKELMNQEIGFSQRFGSGEAATQYASEDSTFRYETFVLAPPIWERMPFAL